MGRLQFNAAIVNLCVCVHVERVSLIAANGQHCHLAADKTVNVNVTVTNGATIAQLPLAHWQRSRIVGGGSQTNEQHVHLAQLSFIAALNDTRSVSVTATPVRPPAQLAT